MDCPYSRGSDRIEDPVTFFNKHTSLIGNYEPYICPEQEAICLGQIKVIANRLSSYLVLDKDLRDVVESADTDYDNFFLYGFIRHHEGRSLPPSPSEKPIQGSLF